MKRFLFFSLVILPASLFAEGGLPEGPAAPEYRVAPVQISQSVHVIYLISPAK
jgi:hypothetical protein